MKTLTLHIKRKWFEQIRDGIKTVEFRRCSNYWTKRLDGLEYDVIHLYCGYPKRGDVSRLLARKWNGCVKTKIQHPEFGNYQVDVYAIDVSQKVCEFDVVKKRLAHF